MKQILFISVFVISSIALITEIGHTGILAANLVTSEKDVVELEKRIQINEDRERVLKDQLRMHYHDLRLAANPTSRVQLERGIESILSELRVLRAASRKFLDKMRGIADGLTGIERNEFIRRHRLERRVGSTSNLKASKITKQAKKQVKKIAKESAKKYSSIAAKRAGKKAVEEAKKKFGNDQQKIKLEKKKAEKNVYKKAYKAIMEEVKNTALGLQPSAFKSKSADIVLRATKKDNIAVDIDKKERSVAVNKAVNKQLKKVLTPAQQESLKKTKKVVQEAQKEIKKSDEEQKQLNKVKEAKKKIQKQKDELVRQNIKMKKAINKEKITKGNLVAKKNITNKPKMNVIKENKRAIEKTVYKTQQRAKQEGLQPMGQQLIQEQPIPNMFDNMPTVAELNKERNMKIDQINKMRQKQRSQLFEPSFINTIPPELTANPMIGNYGPAMDIEEQKQYMSSLFGGAPELPFLEDQYLVNPMEIDAAYNQMLM
ncbi:hypothetical protein EHI8A_104370 [Entamoeba histolytica HM-1:IMSS-B]|uniref:Uncharacterized protein n=6 Tax=Entamoeba histolytica TaxID=5759 RepID=C4LY17_ENTH1|nr:hypothetical protein EHI_177640 [Entamoeba histolytica HM-1:IMSS]EMD48897.1 M protein serotype 5 precursor, putative [Entamoeba histolytica KU27]EMH72581.1 hypothetical protein EHI8A_104370 [Entamoeba histolytica HM-1:IMSS-B]EMS11405.1 M protein, serotype 5 precursor, putative [Entamoeba histolytica HM-3:IMSS]ENY62970.1 M protein, serotype 5 precursor, putative [Entamoeba histolytica HM-1:IMSS-A]BAN39059.1 hypothetical protein [Entamoeba histolytica]|eukprot:XP_655934.1 hypothetical protein EHI_177640 [Entamoeba histolytica HM-1:IMSS]